MSMQDILIAFALSLFAGLSTVLGSIFVLFKKINNAVLAALLGFSAGVMLFISFMEMLAKANDAFAGISGGGWYVLLAFLGGFGLIAVIDWLVPEGDNPHGSAEHGIKRGLFRKKFAGANATGATEVNTGASLLAGTEKSSPTAGAKTRIFRAGLLSCIAIAVHNFPEGLATFAAATQDISLGIAIAVAVSIHNIPEGITIALPIYRATGSRRQAFLFTLISGVCEPLGALIGMLILRPFINDILIGVLFAVVAGIMVFVSLDELLPAARENGHTHIAIYGLAAGMAVMAASLMIL